MSLWHPTRSSFLLRSTYAYYHPLRRRGLRVRQRQAARARAPAGGKKQKFQPSTLLHLRNSRRAPADYSEAVFSPDLEVNMKSKLLVSLGLGALILGASQMANAGVSVGLNFAVPAPVYVAPAPVYVAPQPVYAPPPPPPAVVAYQPVGMPVIAPSVVIGWHGGNYWDGRRWWSRHDWYAHRRW
jgi:hypothetical protein